MKVCSCCRYEKDESEFYRNRSKQDGLSSECRDCSLDRVKKYQTRIRDEIGEAAFRERNREAVRRYRAKKKGLT